MRSRSAEKYDDILLAGEVVDGSESSFRLPPGSSVWPGNNDPGVIGGFEELSLFGEGAGFSMRAPPIGKREGLNPPISNLPTRREGGFSDQTLTGRAANDDRGRGGDRPVRAVDPSRPLEASAADRSGVDLVFALGDLHAGECAILSLYMGLSEAGDEAISRLLSQIADAGSSDHEKIVVDLVAGGLEAIRLPGLAGHYSRYGSQRLKPQAVLREARTVTPRFGNSIVGTAANGLLELGSGCPATEAGELRR